MTTIFENITDEAAWLEKRKGYITSTEIAGLHGLYDSAYQKTAFELYHIKNGNVSGDVEENNFMKFGKLMEAPIAEMILLENPDWKITPFNSFAYNDETKMGSSFDFTVEIDGKKHNLEIKTVTYAQYKEKFVEHSAGDIEAPMNYECQVQQQLEMLKDTCIQSTLIVVFIVDTRSLKYIFRKRDESMGRNMVEAVVEFWDMTEPPSPDYSRDKELLAKVAPLLKKPEEELDATEDEKITSLAAQYKLSKDLIKQEEKNSEEAYAELMHLLGDKKRAWTNNHRITASDIKANEGKAITLEIVGEIVGVRAGYKKLTITDIKKKGTK